MAHFILFITGKHLHSFIPPLFFPSIVLKQWSYSYYPIPFYPVLSHFNATYNCIQSPAVADEKYFYHNFIFPFFLNNFTIPINDSINTTATNGIPASVTANIIYSIPFSRCSHPPVACDTIHI